MTKSVVEGRKLQEHYARVSLAGQTTFNNIIMDSAWAHLKSEHNKNELHSAIKALNDATMGISPTGDPWGTWLLRDLADLRNECSEEMFLTQIQGMNTDLKPAITQLEQKTKYLHNLHSKKMQEDRKTEVGRGR